MEDTFVFVLPQTVLRKMVSTVHFKHDDNSEANEKNGNARGTNLYSWITLFQPHVIQQDRDTASHRN